MPPFCSVQATEKTITRMEIYAVRSGNSCRSLRNGHAAVSGIGVPSKRNLQDPLQLIADKDYLNTYQLYLP